MKKKVIFIILMILMIGAILFIVLNKGEPATTSDSEATSGLEIAIQIPEDYETIQEGIDASKDGDVIIVSPGTYVEYINFNGKAVILGSLFYTTRDTNYISQTIIDGDQKGSVVTFNSGEDSTSVLTGFTITNGQGVGYPDFSGGGITCKNNSCPSLENVTITDNSAEYKGGGICCDSSSPILENVTITGNSAEDDGGGIYCYEPRPCFDNETITDNSAKREEGGGIFCKYSNPSLENVTITDNSAGGNGGGILFSGSNPSLENVTISGNSAVISGGGIFSSSSSPRLVNVTITGNSAEDDGGGIYCNWNSSPSVVNCIFWNNSPQEVYFENDTIWDPSTITIAYSDIEGGEKGIETNNNGTVNWLEGNIAADPLFVNAKMGNYLLTEDSPCVDTGIAHFKHDGEVLIDLSKDEYIGIAPDMGAYK